MMSDSESNPKASDTKYQGHTPGPWYALGKSVRREGAGLDMLAHIAECHANRGPVTITQAEAIANARLIADAWQLPALLARVERLEALLRDAYKEIESDRAGARWLRTEIRAALANGTKP